MSSQPAGDTGGEGLFDAKTILEQRLWLPKAWRYVDLRIVRATEVVLFLVGVAFTAMVTLEVVSRHVFDFSIFFINSAARQLLVWFFLLGAGLALRHGAHVGFELLLRALDAKTRQMLRLIGHAVVLLFFLQMFWSGIHTLLPAMRQVDAALGISLFWVMLAFPVGFALLIYHLITLVVVGYRKGASAEPSI